MTRLLVALLLMPGADDAPPKLQPDRHGVYALEARQATLDGEQLRLSDDDPPVITGWRSIEEHPAWTFDMPKAGRYLVLVEYSAPAGRGGAVFEVEAAGQIRRATVQATGEDRFLPQPLKDAVDLPTGPQTLVVRAVEAPSGHVMRLARVLLVPTETDDGPR